MGVEFLRQDRAVSQDDGHDVIEIMSDSSGQSAHGFHLLCLAKLLFQCSRFGDVLRNPAQAINIAGVVPMDHTAIEDPPDKPVRTDDPIGQTEFPFSVARNRRIERVADQRLVFRVKRVPPQSGIVITAF